MNENDSPQTELPRWACHKEVWAFKITAIESGTDGGALLHVDKEEYLPHLRVSAEYVKKHAPQVGGYYVEYKDGYQSFSPATAFEGGYVRVSETRGGRPDTPEAQADGGVAKEEGTT